MEYTEKQRLWECAEADIVLPLHERANPRGIMTSWLWSSGADGRKYEHYLLPFDNWLKQIFVSVCDAYGDAKGGAFTDVIIKEAERLPCLTVEDEQSAVKLAGKYYGSPPDRSATREFDFLRRSLDAKGFFEETDRLWAYLTLLDTLTRTEGICGQANRYFTPQFVSALGGGAGDYEAFGPAHNALRANIPKQLSSIFQERMKEPDFRRAVVLDENWFHAGRGMSVMGSVINFSEVAKKREDLFYRK